MRALVDAGPLPGLLIGQDQIPGNIQSAGREQLDESGALSIGDFMSSQLQGVSTNDYSGNPFQMDVNYRGFTASPEIGTPEGLSVFFDGIRVNEPFGDVVNWDLLPLNAIERFDLFPGSNPLFGLNTLGGAISLRSRSGFTSPGIDAKVLAGSFQRKQAQLSIGANNDTFGGFAAFQFFDEDGWRDNSPSRVRQAFVRGDWRGSWGVLTATALVSDNDLVGNGLIPDDLYRQRREAVFTSPDKTQNTLKQFALSGALDVTESLNITRAGLPTRQRPRRRERRHLRRLRRLQQRARSPARRAAQGQSEPALVSDRQPEWHRHGSGRQSTSERPRRRQLHERQLRDRDAAVTRGNRGNGFDGTGPGVVDGTPIGLLSTTRLGQVTNGAALQAN